MVFPVAFGFCKLFAPAVAGPNAKGSSWRRPGRIGGEETLGCGPADVYLCFGRNRVSRYPADDGELGVRWDHFRVHRIRNFPSPQIIETNIEIRIDARE